MELDWWPFPFFPNVTIFWLVIILAVVWSIVWKGIALWQAGRHAHLGWFIALFIVNTLGILEIIYLFGFRRVVPRPQKAPPQSKIIKRGDLRIQRERVKRELEEAKQRAREVK